MIVLQTAFMLLYEEVHLNHNLFVFN